MIALDRPLDPAALRAHRQRRAVRPWATEHVVTVVLGNTVAFFVMLVTWWEVSTTGLVRTQMSWIEVGMAGLAISGAANALWLLRSRQALTLARVALLREASLDQLAIAVGASKPTHPNTTPTELVAVHGTARFHRAGCVFVEGRLVEHLTDAEARAQGLEPCQVCRP